MSRHLEPSSGGISRRAVGIQPSTSTQKKLNTRQPRNPSNYPFFPCPTHGDFLSLEKDHDKLKSSIPADPIFDLHSSGYLGTPKTILIL